MSKKQTLSFEEALKRLQEIVDGLESGAIPLDESLKLFEEGVRLSNSCNKELETVERRIEMLIESNGEKKFEEFSVDQ